MNNLGWSNVFPVPPPRPRRPDVSYYQQGDNRGKKRHVYSSAREGSIQTGCVNGCDGSLLESAFLRKSTMFAGHDISPLRYMSMQSTRRRKPRLPSLCMRASGVI